MTDMTLDVLITLENKVGNNNDDDNNNDNNNNLSSLFHLGVFFFCSRSWVRKELRTTGIHERVKWRPIQRRV